MSAGRLTSCSRRTAGPQGMPASSRRRGPRRLELSGESAYAGRCFAAFGDLHQLYAAVSPRHLAHAPARSRAVPAPDIWSVVQVDNAAREATRRTAPAEVAHLSAAPQARLGQAGDTVERWKRWA